MHTLVPSLLSFMKLFQCLKSSGENIISNCMISSWQLNIVGFWTHDNCELAIIDSCKSACN